MPEIVCVTAEQLREIEVQCDDEMRLNWCPACEKFGVRRHEPDCWLVKSIAKAERLENWKLEVGDWVRLRAMPEVKARIDDKKVCPYTDQMMYRLPHEGWRYLAELMPEEEVNAKP